MPVSSHRILFLLFPLFLLIGKLNAQPSGDADPGLDALSRYIQTEYGLDQELFNGFLYYTRYVQYSGDPFFPEDSFYDGSVTIRGVAYDNIRLKYECYSQSLIMEYTDFEERYNQLRLNNDHIDSFRLGTYGFQKLSLHGEEPAFYQVFSSATGIFYIHWEKIIHSAHDDMQFSHEFTRALGTFYFSYKGRIHSIINRRSFVAVFPESQQPEIRKYFRNQRLSFREAGPADIQKLLAYLTQEIEIPSTD
jgi:hypothetical protein